MNDMKIVTVLTDSFLPFLLSPFLLVSLPFLLISFFLFLFLHALHTSPRPTVLPSFLLDLLVILFSSVLSPLLSSFLVLAFHNHSLTSLHLPSPLSLFYSNRLSFCIISHLLSCPPRHLHPLSSVSLLYTALLFLQESFFGLPVFSHPSAFVYIVPFFTRLIPPLNVHSLLLEEESVPTLASVCWLPRQPPEPSYF